MQSAFVTVEKKKNRTQTLLHSISNKDVTRLKWRKGDEVWKIPRLSISKNIVIIKTEIPSLLFSLKIEEVSIQP